MNVNRIRLHWYHKEKKKNHDRVNKKSEDILFWPKCIKKDTNGFCWCSHASRIKTNFISTERRTTINVQRDNSMHNFVFSTQTNKQTREKLQQHKVLCLFNLLYLFCIVDAAQMTALSRNFCFHFVPLLTIIFELVGTSEPCRHCDEIAKKIYKELLVFNRKMDESIHAHIYM